jgi:Protein of unknown function, DUF547
VQENEFLYTWFMEISYPKVATNNLIVLSHQLLMNIKNGASPEPELQRLKTLFIEDLIGGLNNDNGKKAFWINIYNAYTQYLLVKNQRTKLHHLFFSTRKIKIANYDFSPDDIEHGILRGSRTKWGKGYIKKVYVPFREKMLRVKKPDSRIHFALNCGAISCPPIAFYTPDNLDTQLEIATHSFLLSETTYLPEKDNVILPAILKWYSGDFGGKRGIYKLLIKHEIIPNGVLPRIKFEKYNWNLSVCNFKSDKTAK